VVLAVVVALGLVLVAAWLWAYPAYRPSLRPGEEIGIDVSHHQGPVDWQRVAADGVDFAYLKASEGGTVVDERFRESWDGAGEAGLRRGAYHFFTLCRSGADQAAHFLRTAPPDPSALAPAVDLELAGNCHDRPAGTAVRDELADFLSRVENAWGQRVVLYVGDDWEGRYPVLDGSRRPAWLVGFVGRPDRDWAVWQVSWRARVDGIEGPVDLDVGRLDALR
jgi:lysozyme